LIHAEHTIAIRAPIADVFAAATDPWRAPEWNPGVVEITDFSGYPIGEGTTWNQMTMLAGRLMTLRARVQRYDAPREGVIEISGDQRGRVWTRCRREGDVTIVTNGIEVEPPGGLVGRLAGPMIHGVMARELAHSMERQRETLEREARTGGSGTA